MSKRKPNKDRKVEIVLCACGCGQRLNKYDERNRVRKSLPNHLVSLEGEKKGRFKTGAISWNKGKKGLQEAWNKGKTRKQDKRVAQPWLGKKRSQETIRKISKAKKGVKLSTEHKKKLSKVAKEKGFGKWMKKKDLGSEYYRKMGIKGVKIQQSGNPTSIEKKVYKELKERGLLFETQKVINEKFVVDAYIPKFNLVIEADGDYWHNLDRVKKRDRAKNAYLEKCGFGLLRLTETEINNGLFKNKIRRILV